MVTKEAKVTTEKFIENLQDLVKDDIEGLVEAKRSYGNSWKKRGGVGAFMMLARKWDRIENQVKETNYDILSACRSNMSDDGILDDIRDKRRYLLLVEEEVSFIVIEEARRGKK